MWPFRKRESYGEYDPIERMNDTLDGILTALESISEHVEDMAAQVEEMTTDIAALRNHTVGEIVRYIHEQCPYCHSDIWGTKADIDSGMRKHIEFCDAAIEAEANDEIEP